MGFFTGHITTHRAKSQFIATQAGHRRERKVMEGQWCAWQERQSVGKVDGKA